MFSTGASHEAISSCPSVSSKTFLRLIVKFKQTVIFSLHHGHSMWFLCRCGHSLLKHPFRIEKFTEFNGYLLFLSAGCLCYTFGKITSPTGPGSSGQGQRLSQPPLTWTWPQRWAVILTGSVMVTKDETDSSRARLLQFGEKRNSSAVFWWVLWICQYMGISKELCHCIVTRDICFSRKSKVSK